MSFDEIIDLTVYFSVFYIPVYFVCIEVGEITELKRLVNCFIFFLVDNIGNSVPYGTRAAWRYDNSSKRCLIRPHLSIFLVASVGFFVESFDNIQSFHVPKCRKLNSDCRRALKGWFTWSTYANRGYFIGVHELRVCMADVMGIGYLVGRARNIVLLRKWVRL